MILPRAPGVGHRPVFLASAALQIGCGTAFLGEVVMESEGRIHFGIEALAVLALWTGAAITLYGMARLIRRNDSVERQLDAATGAFHAIMEQNFDRWGLTPSEREVAILSIKGVGNGEIAAMRNTREGTVKAQTSAVYRKAGVSGRAELLSLFLDDLVEGIPVPTGVAEAPRTS